METGYQRGKIQDESMLYEQRKHDDFVARMVERGYTEKQVRLLAEWYLRVRKSQ